MFSKNLFNELKSQAQKTFEDIKSEAKKGLEQIEKKIDEQISTKNNLTTKDESFISNSTVNRAAQLLLEKSIKQAEQFIDKYVDPYDVCEILQPEYIKEIISEIKSKIEDGNNDHYYSKLIILYMNLNEFNQANACISNLSDEQLKQKFSIVYKIGLMKDSDFMREFERNLDLILESRIYSILRRYADLCLKFNKFTEAEKILEACCLLNPISEKDHNDLLICYQKLNKQDFLLLHKEIIRSISQNV